MIVNNMLCRFYPRKRGSENDERKCNDCNLIVYTCLVRQPFLTPQDETLTYFDGPSWIQYYLFRNNKLQGSKKVNLVKFILRAILTDKPLNGVRKNNTVSLGKTIMSYEFNQNLWSFQYRLTFKYNVFPFMTYFYLTLHLVGHTVSNTGLNQSKPDESPLQS